MGSQRNKSQSDLMHRNYLIKGAFAGLVIVLCIAFLAWSLWPTPAVVIPPSEDPASNWNRGFAQINQEHATKLDAMYKLFAKITVQPSEDKQSVVVTGRVDSAADLNALKAELAKVQPAVPIDWQVTVGK